MSLSLGRPTAKVAPPQKVIRALVSHRSTNPKNLSYNQGDFWYVTGERDDWYEALNPLTSSRGLVPRKDFEEFNKGGINKSNTRPPSQEGSRSHTPSTGHMSQSSNPRSPPVQVMSPTEMSKRYAPVYAKVVYDFIAERPDELAAKAGDSIVIIAQSNHEWFVAKPIGRLGGPGLIPVTFVQIRDTITDQPIDRLPDHIPLVEEWKQATANYNAAKIPLGRFDFAPGDSSVADSPYGQSSNSNQQSSTSLPRSGSQSSLSIPAVTNGRNGGGSGSRNSQRQRSPIYRPEVDAHLPPGLLTALSVPSFHNESGNFWFRLQVTFLPDDPSGPGYTLALYRTYEDFYEFQITLLDTFPYEAGRPMSDRDSSPPRVLPFMPGPVEEEIDDELTEYRREELDTYVRSLIELGDQGKDYILRHELFRAFFAAKYGDHCEEVSRSVGGGGGGRGGEGVEELDERMGAVSVREEEGYGVPNGDGRSGSAAGHARGQSQSQPRNNSYDRQSATSNQASSQPGPSRTTSTRNPSPLPPIDTSRPTSSGSQAYSSSAHVRQPSSSAHSHSQHGHTIQPFSAGPSTGASSSFGPGTAAAGSSRAGGGNPPPYIKIKIYDRSTDDLIAIRVHPDVNHAELFEKVRARLGNEVRALRYRTGMGSGVNPAAGGGYEELRDDEELRWWLGKEDQKLVLYAEQ